MNRRNFIASLVALPTGLMAAAQTMSAQQVLFVDPSDLVACWFQGSRVSRSSTLEYEDELDRAFGLPESERRLNWHSRRKERCRARLSLLKTQRPLPLP